MIVATFETGLKKIMINADNFWIELDRLLGAPTTAAQMKALMESYAPVWPDIHDRAINSQTTLGP